MNLNTGLCIIWCVFWIGLFGCIAAINWARAFEGAARSTPAPCAQVAP